MPGALDGVRVVDFGHYIAGPLAATMLTDQGADVIHVDPSGGPRWKSDADAFLNRRLRSWKELVFPFAMCFMQYAGSRKVRRSVFNESYYVMKND